MPRCRRAPLFEGASTATLSKAVVAALHVLGPRRLAEAVVRRGNWRQCRGARGGDAERVCRSAGRGLGALLLPAHRARARDEHQHVLAPRGLERAHHSAPRAFRHAGTQRGERELELARGTQHRVGNHLDVRRRAICAVSASYGANLLHELRGGHLGEALPVQLGHLYKRRVALAVLGFDVVVAALSEGPLRVEDGGGDEPYPRAAGDDEVGAKGCSRLSGRVN
mmetsp:Transcript_51022/g.117349  ORF Transcript_51022/g.117349 Transcript_51022/m.117349 type:complete len:224 (+) Transcript_51022:203-874(+)